MPRRERRVILVGLAKQLGSPPGPQREHLQLHTRQSWRRLRRACSSLPQHHRATALQQSMSLIVDRREEEYQESTL